MEIDRLTDKQLALGYQRGKREYLGILLERYSPLIKGLMRKYSGRIPKSEKKDFYSVINLFFIEYANEYRNLYNGYDISFANYINKKLNCKVKYQMIKILKEKTSPLLWEVHSGDTNCSLRNSINDLPKGLRKIIKQYYFVGLTQGEIGERMGISQPTVCRKLKKAIQSLRNIMA